MPGIGVVTLDPTPPELSRDMKPIIIPDRPHLPSEIAEIFAQEDITMQDELEREFWERAYCAAFSINQPPYSPGWAARMADQSVEEWRKRWGNEQYGSFGRITNGSD